MKILNRVVPLFIALCLLVSCKSIQAPASQAGNASSPESQSTASGTACLENQDATALLSEADGPVPDFLTAEQQTLYRKAKTAYMQFSLNNTGFGSSGAADSSFEHDGLTYFKCDGPITQWDDFESAMLCVFTPEYFTALNKSASYTDGQGVLHERTVFMQRDGALYYAAGARGANISFLAPETFRLFVRGDAKLVFNVVANYKENPFADDASPAIQQEFELSMEKSADGWRFSRFALAY